MAEFCLDCWNKINGTHLTEEDAVLSDDLDFCEECEEMKPVIVTLGNTRKKRRGFFTRRR